MVVVVVVMEEVAGERGAGGLRVGGVEVEVEVEVSVAVVRAGGV